MGVPLTTTQNRTIWTTQRGERSHPLTSAESAFRISSAGQALYRYYAP